MNLIAVILGLALAVWLAPPLGYGSKAMAADKTSSIGVPAERMTGMSVHQLLGQTHIDRLPVAPADDHGFIFPVY